MEGPWPGCQGIITVGTIHTVCPRRVSAKDAARNPTLPRITSEEIAATVRPVILKAPLT